MNSRVQRLHFFLKRTVRSQLFLAIYLNVSH